MNDDSGNWLTQAIDEYHRREAEREAVWEARVQTLLNEGVTPRQMSILRDMLQSIVLERDEQWTGYVRRMRASDAWRRESREPL